MDQHNQVALSRTTVHKNSLIFPIWNFLDMSFPEDSFQSKCTQPSWATKYAHVDFWVHFMTGITLLRKLSQKANIWPIFYLCLNTFRRLFRQLSFQWRRLNQRKKVYSCFLGSYPSKSFCSKVDANQKTPAEILRWNHKKQLKTKKTKNFFFQKNWGSLSPENFQKQVNRQD